MKDGLDPSEWRRAQKERQDKLNKALSWLRDNEVESRDDLAQIATQLLEVYSDAEFRHHYADMLEIIHVIEDERIMGAEKTQQIKVRGENLASGIRQLYIHKCSEECQGDNPCPIRLLQKDHRLHKLYDHANLEARRASYEADAAAETLLQLQKAREEAREARYQLNAATEALNKGISVTEKAVDMGTKTMSAADKANSIATAATEKANDANEKAIEAVEKVKRQQIEMVSVLGVFSAIILAFNEGVVFSTSSIAAVDRQSPFQIAFVVAIVGFILFNCLYGAFALVYRIVRPNGSPDHLLEPRRIIGIELASAGCVSFLGVFAYSYIIELYNLQFVAAAISLFVFSVGIGAIGISGKNRGNVKDSSC